MDLNGTVVYKNFTNTMIKRGLYNMLYWKYHIYCMTYAYIDSDGNIIIVNHEVPECDDCEYHIMEKELIEELNNVLKRCKSQENDNALMEIAEMCNIPYKKLKMSISWAILSHRVENGDNLLSAIKVDNSFRRYITDPKIRITRVYGNNKKDTFDFIYVDISVNVDPSERKEWVIKYKKELIDIALNKLKEDNKFTKYNIPINFLKIGDIILRRDGILQIIFELKEMG